MLIKRAERDDPELLKKLAENEGSSPPPSAGPSVPPIFGLQAYLEPWARPASSVYSQ
jgi:hypothetical protein